MKLRDTIELIEVKKLIPYQSNARLHTDDQVNKLASIIAEYGFDQPIVCDENNIVIKGHGRLLALKKLEWDNAPCIKIKGLTEAEKRALRVSDNSLNDVSDWDEDLLKEEILKLKEEGFDLDLLGLSDENLELGVVPNEEDESVVEEIVARKSKYNVCQGELWVLGSHRLMCGNATNETEVAMLMNGKHAICTLTDPPYNTGMSINKNSSSTRLNHMFDDDFTDEKWTRLQKSIFRLSYNNMTLDSVLYLFCDWRRVGEWIHWLKTKYHYSNLIVWDKVVHGLGSDYQYTHEFILVGRKGKPVMDTHQNTEYKDIWHVQRKVGKNKDHATAKPIELLHIPIRHSTKRGDIVLDLFGGSGSTLIACEQLNRKCYMMEIDPHYCSVIIERYETLTGNKAKRENGRDTELNTD